jgi:hypothetical protein
MEQNTETTTEQQQTPMTLDPSGSAQGNAGSAQGNAGTGIVINPDGTFRDGWTANEALAKKFSSLDALTRSYENLERMLGTEKMPVPKDDSPADVWDSVFAKLGRPDSPDHYKLDKPADLPEGIKWDDSTVGEFRAIAHKLGLSQKQAQALVQYDLERSMRTMTSFQQMQEQELQASEQALRSQWGGNFEANLDLARQAAAALDESIMADPRLANNPKVIDLLAKVGSMMSESKLTAPRGMVTMHTDVDGEIAQIQNRNPSHPLALAYWNAQHPDHQKAVDYMFKLYARKFPEAR